MYKHNYPNLTQCNLTINSEKSNKMTISKVSANGKCLAGSIQSKVKSILYTKEEQISSFSGHF